MRASEAQFDQNSRRLSFTSFGPNLRLPQENKQGGVLKTLSLRQFATAHLHSNKVLILDVVYFKEHLQTSPCNEMQYRIEVIAKTSIAFSFFLALACLLKVAACYNAQSLLCTSSLERAVILTPARQTCVRCKMWRVFIHSLGGPLLAVANRHPPGVDSDLMQINTL